MTIFDKIIRKEIPATIVFEDDQCLCFKDIDPKAPVHLLLIPKRRIASLATVTPQDAGLLAHLMLKIPEIAKAQGLADSGFRVVSNSGKEGGQTVDHLHFHILGGRAMHWPPG